MTYFRDQSLQSAVNSSSYTVSSTPSSPQPPKVFSKLILAVYSTWQGIQVETSSLSTTRHDCTDAWCIAIFIVLCKFWIILVYECFRKITIKLFIKGGWVPEILSWLYCVRHQITSPYKASLRPCLGGQLDQRRGTRPGTVTAVFVLCTVVQVSDSYLKGVKLHTCTIDIVLLVFKLQRLIPSGHIFYNSIHNAKLKKL